MNLNQYIKAMVRINLIIMLFMGTVINAQTTTYTIKEKPNANPYQSTYEVKKTDDIATQMLNHSRNLSSIRSRVQGEMNEVVSEGQKIIMGLKPENINSHTTRLLFMAQDIAFKEVESQKDWVKLGLKHKNALPGLVNDVVLKYSKLITALDIIGSLDASQSYQKSLSYINGVNDEFEAVLNGAIYNGKIKLSPMDMVQFVQESDYGNLNNFENAWLEESLLTSRYENFRENIIAQRSKYIDGMDSKKDVRKFISKELEWAYNKIRFYWGIKKRFPRDARLLQVLEKLNFSSFFERPSYEQMELSDREIIIDYVNFMNNSTSVNYNEFEK